MQIMETKSSFFISKTSLLFFLPALIHSTGQQFIQIHGFELLAGQGLLQRRKIQNDTKHGSHSSVIGKCLIVKNKILQGPFFNGLQHKPVRAVHRGYDLYRAPL